MCVLYELAKPGPSSGSRGLQQPQSPALLQEGSRLAGEGNVPTAFDHSPGSHLGSCCPDTAQSRVWNPRGRGDLRDRHMPREVLPVLFSPCSWDGLTSCLHHSRGQSPRPSLPPSCSVTLCTLLGAAHLPSLGARTLLSPDKDTHHVSTGVSRCLLIKHELLGNCTSHLC